MKYATIRSVADKLRKIADLVDHNGSLHEHPAMIAAEESGDDVILYTVATGLVTAQVALKNAVNNIELLAEKVVGDLDAKDIDSIAALAAEFDDSDDPFLQKQASVLDQLLVNFAQKENAQAKKKAEDSEVEKLREKHRQLSHERAYEKPAQEHDKDIKAAERAKEIQDSIKQYRPLEAPLSTRYCPDHAGAPIMRIGEGVYQCALDKKLYNWHEGYTTMRGNKVPGGRVDEQTLGLGDRALESMHFSTRESRLSD